MRVLEAREIGHGILVEHDGHIKPDDNTNMLREMAKDDFGGEIYMNAILQKYDTPNRNGRIYPEKILRRENNSIPIKHIIWRERLILLRGY